MKTIVSEIYKFLELGLFESTYIIYLKNPIKVGENDNGDILCTYIDRAFNPYYDYDHISINVILDEKECDLYGTDYEFESIQFKEHFDFKPTFIIKMTENNLSKGSIKILPNALELILDELKSTGVEWVKHQKQLQIRSRWFHRNAIWKHTKQFEDQHTPLNWEQHREWLQVKAEIEDLSWRRPINHDLKTLARMDELGEIEYNKEQAKFLKMLKEIDLD